MLGRRFSVDRPSLTYYKCTKTLPVSKIVDYIETRSQAVARIADRTAKNCKGHVT